MFLATAHAGRAIDWLGAWGAAPVLPRDDVLGGCRWFFGGGEWILEVMLTPDVTYRVRVSGPLADMDVIHGVHHKQLEQSMVAVLGEFTGDWW